MSVLERIAAEERGSVLTEFVITLPLFIMIFSGIVGLHKLQDSAGRAHVAANRTMWELADEVAKSEPESKWGDPARIGRYESVQREENETFSYDQTKFMRLFELGTLGEAMTGANYDQVAGWSPETLENIAQSHRFDPIDDRVRPVDADGRHDGHDRGVVQPLQLGGRGLPPLSGRR